MRVGPDSAPSWIARNGRLQQALQRDHILPCLCHSIRNEMTRTWMHYRWWVNDSDALLLSETQTELNDDEILAQLTLKGLSGGLLFLADDLDHLPQQHRANAAKLFPLLHEGMDVLDLFSRTMPEEVVVPVMRPWGHWTLVGLFNWSDQPVERTLPTDIPLQSNRAYHFMDFWNERYLYMPPGAVRPVLHLAPHGVALLSIRPAQSGPHLVGTTFHISQGAEITLWEADQEIVRLSLELRRLGLGEVWLALPSRPPSVMQNGQELPTSAVRAIASGVWAVKCAVNHDAELLVRLPSP
jgi:alpha-galactosidase